MYTVVTRKFIQYFCLKMKIQRFIDNVYRVEWCKMMK